MTTTGPMQELMASGLHRLAQPLTAGLWLVESSEDGEQPSLNLDRLGRELRRASAMLRFLRAALDVPTAAAQEWLSLPVWLAAQTPRWEKECRARGVRLIAASSAPMNLRCNREMLSSAADALLEQLLLQASARDTLTVMSGAACLEFCLRYAAPHGDAAFQQALEAFDPFETPLFDFTATDVPPGLVARGLFAACGLGMSVHSAPPDVTVRLHALPQAVEVTQ